MGSLRDRCSSAWCHLDVKRTCSCAFGYLLSKACRRLGRNSRVWLIGERYLALHAELYSLSDWYKASVRSDSCDEMSIIGAREYSERAEQTSGVQRTLAGLPQELIADG
jgi:hypothetical protein